MLKAIQDQENRLQHTTTIYLHNEVAQYAKELTDRMPGNLKASAESYECVGRDICRLRLTEGGAVRQGARRSHAQLEGGWQARPVIRMIHQLHDVVSYLPSESWRSTPIC